MPKALVIGAGIAGLAVALRLRKKGYEVAVFEKNRTAGGKISDFKLGDYRFDWGPSLFTMPHLITELFVLFNKNPDEHFKYIRKTSSCNYFWEDGTRFVARARKADFVSDAAAVFNEHASTIKKYLDDSEKKYSLTASVFLEKSLHKINTYLSKDTLKALLNFNSLDLNTSLNNVNQKSFNNPKIIQLFNRFATYNGSDPYQTPGIMSMIPHLELNLGTYFPKDGMRSVAESLYTLACNQGIEFHFNTDVKEIITSNGTAKGIRTEKLEYKGNIIISNSDHYNTSKMLLRAGDKNVSNKPKQERSSAAIIFYWGIAKKFPELDLHNILFSKEYQEEFNAIFNDSTIIENPTIYINITSKDKPSDAPNGCENWFVMINAPSANGQDWPVLRARVRAAIILRINSLLKTDIEKYITHEEILDPLGIEAKTGSYGGALYGASSNSKLAAFLRQQNFSTKIKNLYFCGGSVHPGGGIPLCLLSAKITSDLIPKASSLE